MTDSRPAGKRAPRPSPPEEHPEYEHVLRGHVRRLEALNSVTALISQSLDPDEAVRAALRTTLAVMPADAGAVILTDPATGDLVFKVQIGWRPVTPATEPLRLPAGQGLCAQVAHSDQPLTVDDLTPDPRLSMSEFGDQAARALALAPLHARGKALGVLSVMTFTPRHFTDDEVSLLCAIADQVGVAVENAQLYQAEQRQRRLAEALRQVALVLNSTLDLATVLDLIVEQLKSVVPYDSVSVVLKEEGRYTLVVAHGYSGDMTALVELDHGELPGIQQLLAQRQPLLIADTQLDPRWRTLHVPDRIRSWLGVPLLNKDKDQVLGILGIDHYQPQAYTADDVRAAFIFADQAAVAIENARLYEETKRRLDESSLLYEMSVAGTSSLDFAEVSKRTVEALQRSIGFEYVALFLVNDDHETVELYATSGLAAELERHSRIKIGRGIVGSVVASGTLLNVPDVRQDPRHLPGIAATRSELCVPLRVGERVIGAIDLQSSRPAAFSTHDELLLSAVAGQWAVLLDNTRLYAETQQRLAEVSTLYALAEKLSSRLDLPELLDLIVTTLRRVLNCRGVSISLLMPETQTLEIRAAAGLQDKWRQSANLKVGEGVSGQVAATATPLYVPDARSLPDFIFFDPVVRSLLVVPLTVKDRVIGTLAIDQTAPAAFGKDDERLLVIAAAQAAVAIENAQLYAVLKERADKLEKAYQELQKLDQLKDELVQNVSHELRTPLTFIKGYVELILEQDLGPLNEAQRESLSIVAEKTTALTRLVSDIIFFQQIERESLELAPHSLRDVAKLALQACEVAGANAGIALRLDAPDVAPPITIDRDRINQVFDNLLGNAIKFSPRGGTITIGVEDQGDHWRLSVADTGVGIPADKLRKVFDRFYQVDGSATRRFGGAGLGLAIAKRIVESHGGEIWVESDGVPGHGSRFVFTLPKVLPLVERPRYEAAPAADGLSGS